MHNLPGTDPRFHESRNYLSPVKYKGEHILAAHGSCKEQGCAYSSAWTSNRARDRGMWLHRALQVREARAKYFYERFPKPGDERVAQLFNETADHNSHLFSVWEKLVKGFFFNLVGDDATILVPDYNYYQDYKQGNFALDTAKFLVDGR
jgi:hypothetical protein